MCTLSFGAGCYGNHQHVPSRSNPDRAGNCDTVGIGIEIPSYSHCGSRSTQPDGRLRGQEMKKKQENQSMSQNKEKYSLTEIAFFRCVPSFQMIVNFGWEKHYVYSWYLTTLVKHVCRGGRNETGWRIGVLLTTNLCNAFCSFYSHLLHSKNINDPNWLAFPPNCSLVSRRPAQLTGTCRSTMDEHSWLSTGWRANIREMENQQKKNERIMEGE